MSQSVSTFGIPGLDPQLESSLTHDMASVESLLRSHIVGKYPLVIETSRHLVEAGGKRLRPLLTLLGAQFGSEPTNNLQVIQAAVVCELTHLATLYHDDVMDEAPLRRGVESANNRWNNTVAILTGDYLFAKTSGLLAELGPEAVRIHAETFERLVIGQIMETQGSTAGLSLLEHYTQVIADKTGSLIATSARYGAMFAGASTRDIEILTKYGEKIGILFQLADDIIDIASESAESGKTPGTDLREGVPTMVTVHILESDEAEDAKLKKVLSAPIHDEAIVEKTLLELRTHRAMDISRALLIQYANEAKTLVSDLGDGAAKEALISLCDAIITRTA
jgi:heptaprenyl diphosphate synthase